MHVDIIGGCRTYILHNNTRKQSLSYYKRQTKTYKTLQYLHMENDHILFDLKLYILMKIISFRKIIKCAKHSIKLP